MCISLTVGGKLKVPVAVADTIHDTQCPKPDGTFELYKRGKLLGNGQSCVCFEMTSCDSGITYCCKVIPSDYLQTSESIRNNVSMELKQHKHFAHPHIVKMWTWWEARGNIYIMLDKCQSNLRARLTRKGRFSEQDTRIYVKQILCALFYLREKGFYHGDLKLDNILCKDSSDMILLADFGSLKVSGNISCNDICGTPNYVSPESLSAQQSDPSDMWSLGVCIYAMLLRFLPFESCDVNRTYQRIRENQYYLPLHHQLSEDATDMISKLLVSDPVQRITLEKASQHRFLTSDNTIKKTELPPREFEAR
jgi:polo-like kinase 1